jgi:hypothetical protein
MDQAYNSWLHKDQHVTTAGIKKITNVKILNCFTHDSHSEPISLPPLNELHVHEKIWGPLVTCKVYFTLSNIMAKFWQIVYNDTKGETMEFSGKK